MSIINKKEMRINEQKEKRKNDVINAAIGIFIEKGIENTKMTDIANESNVGVASIYRYFNTKTDLAIAAGSSFWEKEINTFYPSLISNLNEKDIKGIDKIKSMLEVFHTLYEKYPNFLKFIEIFDTYIVKEGVPKDKLMRYENNVINVRPLFFSTLDDGKKDGTIRTDIDNNAFYTTITHSLISLSQKLILRGNVLKADSDIPGNLEIKLLIDMAISYIQNK